MYNNREIIELLNGEGLTSSTGKPFTLEMISWIRYKHRIPGPLPPAGTLTVGQVRQRYGVSLWVVHYWIQRRIVPATQRRPNAPYAITIDRNLDRRLRKCVALIHHPQRELHEVHYARCVGTPKIRCPPVFLGMGTARTGGGK